MKYVDGLRVWEVLYKTSRNTLYVQNGRRIAYYIRQIYKIVNSRYIIKE